MSQNQTVTLSLDTEAIKSLDAITPKLSTTAFQGNPGRSQSARFLIAMGAAAFENESVRAILLSGHSTFLSVLKELHGKPNRSQ